MLTALYLMQCLPQQGLFRHVIELGDSHPSHGAHVPPLSLGVGAAERGGGPGLND